MNITIFFLNIQHCHGVVLLKRRTDVHLKTGLCPREATRIPVLLLLKKSQLHLKKKQYFTLLTEKITTAL